VFIPIYQPDGIKINNHNPPKKYIKKTTNKQTNKQKHKSKTIAKIIAIKRQSDR